MNAQLEVSSFQFSKKLATPFFYMASTTLMCSSFSFACRFILGHLILITLFRSSHFKSPLLLNYIFTVLDLCIKQRNCNWVRWSSNASSSEWINTSIWKPSKTKTCPHLRFFWSWHLNSRNQILCSLLPYYFIFSCEEGKWSTICLFLASSWTWMTSFLMTSLFFN